MTVPSDGYFPPGSVSRRVIGDPAAGVGGVRALFLQALHPRVMAGVEQHSSFPDDFWPRLQRTAQYVITVTFGSVEQADAQASRVRAVHQLVRGIDPVSGLGYAADDPDLLRWVHVAEVSSFLDVARRAGLSVSDSEADEYFAEQTRAAALLGATDVPGNRAEVADYFRQVRPALQTSTIARRAAVRLMLPPLPPRIEFLTPARPAWTALAGLAFALLPRWARRLYGLPGLPMTDLAATVALRALRTGVLIIPESLRPHRRPDQLGLGGHHVATITPPR
jgi:uncharacterized protein (DUF2236 family)